VPIVVADTGPINYLILIGHVDVLPVLFDQIVLPSAVRDELMAANTPALVQNWIAALPAWLDVRAAAPTNDASLAALDAGEKAAITLAIEFHAELLLMDDRRGVKTARSKGFRVTGTLAILSMAARRNLLNLADAFDRLKQTKFHCTQAIMDQFLAEQGGKGW
jgi:predicted nucleic acid-binding protein